MTWPMKRLRYLATFNPSVPAFVRADAEGSYPLLPMDSINEFTETGAPEVRPVGDLLNGYSYLEPTDVAYAKVTPCFENGKGLIGSVLNGPTFATTEITVLRPHTSVNQRFLGYLLQSSAFRHEAIASMTGAGGLKRVSEVAMRDLRVPAPPLEEQKLIADYLDREIAEIDAMATELDQAMVLIDERFQAEVERCFDSLDAPHMPLRSQIQSMTTGTSVTAAKFAPAAGEPGVLATSAVFGHDLDEAAVKSVDPHEYARLTCPLRVNTLLVSRMNTMNLVGKAVTVDRHLPDVYLPDRLWAVEVEVPRYVYWWTRSQSYREQIRGLAVGASDSMKTLSQQAFRGITLPVPPVPQQDAVAAQLDESAELTGTLKAELQEAKVVLEERRAALISAAVTGQVDVTSHGVSAAEQLRDELEVHV
ncbi:restriction endonuclease subunit S [Corynebacterium variabile]|uniref:restriction endonuclease subunit S n=1 Tax=Corynebacterium variabile TaxID=1727 RepID=UPI003FD34DDA